MGNIPMGPNGMNPDEPNQELIDAYYDIPLTIGRVAIGKGETVGSVYSRAFARLYFLKTLHRLVPETTASLGTENARAAARIESESWRALWPDIEAASNSLKESSDLLEVGPIKPPLRESMERSIELIDKWIHTPEAEAMKKAAGFLSQHVGA